MEQIAKFFNELGIALLAFFINSFYILIFILPIFLVGFLVGGNISRYIILFLPLFALFGFAFESEAFAYREIFYNGKKYYKKYFLNTVKDKFIRKYLFYLVTFNLCYYSLTSLYMLNGYSPIIKIIYYIFLFIDSNILFYSIMQMALREYTSGINVLQNSLLITFRYFIISVIVFFISLLFIRIIAYNKIFIFIYISIMAFLMNFVNDRILSN